MNCIGKDMTTTVMHDLNSKDVMGKATGGVMIVWSLSHPAEELRTSAVSCFTKCCSSSAPSGPQTPPPGFSQFAHLCCSSHFFLTLSVQ